MKILNLYAGLGGNRKEWKNCEVTSIEKDKKIADVYKNLFPFDKIIIGDAHNYLQENYYKYDFIWSSPPCQSHTRFVLGTRHKKKKFPDFKLYEEIIFLKTFFKGKWVVENVEPFYDPFEKDLVSKLGRHYVWSNFQIPNMIFPSLKNTFKKTNTKGSEELKKYLGINYEGNIYYSRNHCPAQVLRNAVHPEIGKYIMNCLLNQKKDIMQEMSLF